MRTQPPRFIANALAVLVFLAFRVSAQVFVDPSPEVTLKRWDVHSFAVPAGQASFPILLTVDTGTSGRDLIDVSSSDPGVHATLILPNGIEVATEGCTSLGIDCGVISQGAFLTSQIDSVFSSTGTHTYFALPPGSAGGAYKVSVETTLATQPVLITVSYFSSSSISAGLVATSTTYHVGDIVILAGIVQENGSPIVGASFDTAVIRMDSIADAPVPVDLLDSGTNMDRLRDDGVYTGYFVASRPGVFFASTRIAGSTISGDSFSRTASTQFRVIGPTASLGSISDVGVDDDGDDAIDRVVVTANVQAQVPGNYRLSIKLSTEPAGGGASIEAAVAANLSIGAHFLPISFSVAELLKLGIDGPYFMSDATLVFLDDPQPPMVDYRADAGITGPYAQSSLDRGSIYFTGANDHGTNVDEGGHFGGLTVDVGVNVKLPGDYQWSGRLVDSKFREIGFFAATTAFVAGANTMEFNFDGADICVDGPYTLRAVLLTGPAGRGRRGQHSDRCTGPGLRHRRGADSLRRGHVRGRLDGFRRTSNFP